MTRSNSSYPQKFGTRFFQQVPECAPFVFLPCLLEREIHALVYKRPNPPFLISPPDLTRLSDIPLYQHPLSPFNSNHHADRLGICEPLRLPDPPTALNLTSHLQYHSDGRLRNTPLPSTIHGWLTKMRGTLLDNEALRYEGIKEMKQASVVRIRKLQVEADLKLKNVALARAGKPLLKTAPKPPLLRLSFLRNRPKPVAGTSGRQPSSNRKQSSAHTQKRKPASSSRSRHTSTSGKRTSRRPHPSKKSSHSSHTSKRSSRK